ncbi:MAG: RidA family protein [Candidatus Thermoplasmatota archaeon]|nr:RidA family protein [Candidatus Thermoplasmatota archaeon]MCL5785737.1 RidA family protein [Candidatus Thermoplasmatota archaeon]
MAKLHNPATMHRPSGYSHVAEVTGKRIVFIAGQVAINSDGNLVGRDDYASQTRQVFENLKAAVTAAGGNMKNLIKLNYYFLDVTHLPEIRSVRDEYIDMDAPPVSTAIEVRRLFRPDILIEIDAVAEI